jgi:hypothetical protein
MMLSAILKNPANKIGLSAITELLSESRAVSSALSMSIEIHAVMAIAIMEISVRLVP